MDAERRILSVFVVPSSFGMDLALTAGEPAMADVNHDGTPDLIATFLLADLSKDAIRWVVVGISGRSGEWLWSHPFDQTPTRTLATDRHGPAVLVESGKSRLVAYVDGAEWLGLDPATGKLRAGPIDLGFHPVAPVQYADLDGDGEPEILALGPGPAAAARALRAVSIKSGRELWVATVDAAYTGPSYGLFRTMFRRTIDH